MKLTPSNNVWKTECMQYLLCFVSDRIHSLRSCLVTAIAGNERKNNNIEIKKLVFGKNVCLYVIKFRYKLHWKHFCARLFCVLFATKSAQANAWDWTFETMNLQIGTAVKQDPIHTDTHRARTYLLKVQLSYMWIQRYPIFNKRAPARTHYHTRTNSSHCSTIK